MRFGRRATTSIGLALLSAALSAGAARAEAGKLRIIARAFLENQQELEQYCWRSRTEVHLDGELQQVSLAEVRYDGGEVRRRRIGDEEPADRVPARKKISRRRRRKVAEMAAGLEDLIRSYTRLDARRMQSAVARAHVWEGEGEQAGTARVQARNVARQGDSVNMWVDSATRLPLRFEILTSMEGEPVRFTTEFARLEQGPTYAALTVVKTEIKEKTMLMRIEQYDLARDAGEGE